eukprot:g108.t1
MLSCVRDTPDDDGVEGTDDNRGGSSKPTREVALMGICSCKGKGGICPNLDRCRQVSEAMGLLGEEMHVPEYDRCFCAACSTARGEVNKLYTRGEYPYVLPSGWCRLALPLTARQIALTRGSPSQQPHAPAFHATSLEATKKILAPADGFPQLLQPNDELADGTVLRVRPGHISEPQRRTNQHTKQTETFDPTRMIFCSPSIRYCERTAYMRTTKVNVPDLGEVHVQLALSVRLKEGTFGIGQQTVNHKLTRRICEVVPNECLEYYTSRRQIHFIDGLLIRIVNGPLATPIPQRDRTASQRPPRGIHQPAPAPAPPAMDDSDQQAIKRQRNLFGGLFAASTSTTIAAVVSIAIASNPVGWFVGAGIGVGGAAATFGTMTGLTGMALAWNQGRLQAGVKED